MKKMMVFVVALFCIFCIPAYSVYADTDGTELQVAQPEKLEIQLGVEWAGVEFQLKTDAGLYPGTIVVGSDGVLRTELGGSQSYILSCMTSKVAVPDPAQVPATNEPEKLESQDEMSTENVETPKDTEIPILDAVVFTIGMILAIGSLIAFHIIKKRKASSNLQDPDLDEE